MKLNVLYAFVLFTACSSIGKQSDAEVFIYPDSTAVSADTTLAFTDTPVQQYEAYLKTLDASQVNNVRAAYLNYEWMFKNQSTAVCDSGYALFESFYNLVFGMANNTPPVVSVNPERLKQMKEALLSYGFEPAQMEGEWYYQQNRKVIHSFFSKYVSKEMNAFMEMMYNEDSNKYASEGGLNISAKELVQRFIQWNEFCRTQPGFILKLNAEEYAILYGSILIQGIENTPLQTGEPKQLNSYYADAYDELLSKYNHISYVPKFKAYKEALLNNDEMAVSAFHARWLPYEVPR
jgi:hypothetical protein